MAVFLLTRDTHPPVAIGGADVEDVAGGNFPGRGDLIDDEDLLERAADRWRESRDDLADPVRALWAGELPQGRTVILQSRGDFRAVQFSGRDEEGALGSAKAVGDRFIVTPAGVLFAEGLPRRWTTVSLDFRTSQDGLAGTAVATAGEGLLAVEIDDSLLALIPVGTNGGTVNAIAGDRGALTAIQIDNADWPRFRDAMADGLFAPFASAAVAAVVGDLGIGLDVARHVRLLHVGDVPGGDIGVAASASARSRTLIGFGSGRAVEPLSELLGVASGRRPALAARSLTSTRDAEGGPWLVAAGDPDVRRIEIEGGSVHRGNFALVERSERTASDVRGRLADGSVVRAVGS